MTFRPYQLAALAFRLGLPSEPIARMFDRPHSNQPRPSSIPREERERRKATKARAAASRRRNQR